MNNLGNHTPNYVIEKIEEKARAAALNWQEIEKAILIRSIDTLWVEHLEAMASLRPAIRLLVYGQRDPLVEYKKEAYQLFNQLQSMIQKEVAYSIYKIGGMHEAPTQFSAPGLADRAKQFSAPAKVMDSSTTSFSGFKQADAGGASGSGDSKKQVGDKREKDVVRTKVKDAKGKKVGRNDPCPCGSGKKFKKCCGR